MLCFVILIMSLSQRRNDRRNRNRNRGRKPNEPEMDRIHCYTCYLDFTLQRFDNLNSCYNPSLNITLAEQEHLTQCSPATRFCTVDITRVNDVLAIVDRRCGQSTCQPLCVAKGYGIERQTCTYCCGGKLTEDDENFDEENNNYKCPTVPH